MIKYQIIVNPESGRKRGGEIGEVVKRKLESTGIDCNIHFSEGSCHALILAQNIGLENTAAIIVIGGDGTIHEVINGLMRRSDKKMVPLGFIPAGTGNSLLHDLGVVKVNDAIKHILNGKTRRIDLMKISMIDMTVYSFNVIGFGLGALTNRRAETMRWLGGWRYNCATIIELFKAKSYDVDMKVDDHNLKTKVNLLIALNTCHTGKGLKMAPDARIDDGLIHVLVGQSMSKWKLFLSFLRIFKGTHLEGSDILCYPVRTFSIDSPKGSPLMLDGQDSGHTPIDVTILPGVLEIFG